VCDRARYLLQIALGYGFESQHDTACFVYIGYFLGPDFDLHPNYAWLKKKLADTSVSPDARMAAVWQELIERFEKAEDVPAVG
jgi:hypothetical protein